MPGALPDKLLMCGKCRRKLGADGKALRKSLQKSLQAGHGGAVQLVKTGCFSLCPKQGLVLATMRKPRERRLVVLQPGAAIGDALDYLLGASAPPGG